MRHKLISIVIALAFLVLIQSFSDVFKLLLIAMTGYLIVVMAYNYWYLRKNNLYTFWFWIRPFFLLASMVGLYFVVPKNIFQGLFLLFAVGLIYFLELRILIASEQVLFLETLISYFGLALGIFGLNFYLLPKNTVTILLLGFVTFFITRASLDYIPQPASKKSFFSWFIAFCIIEISWAMVFLPIHFTALALIIFNIFYVLWIITYYHLFHNLTLKKISFHVIFSTIIVLLTLISTPWKA